MALDTFESVTRSVKTHCPKADLNLAKTWVRNGFRELGERRPWSWLIKRGQFLMPARYNTGTASVTRDSSAVTGSGTTWTSAMEGRQFRVGSTGSLYTIKDVISATSIVLDANFGGTTNATAAYSIYQAYVTAPTDFLTFVSVTLPSRRWKLHTFVQQGEIDRTDSSRENTGNPYLIAARDYTTTRTGSVFAPIQALGSGAAITSVTSGSYTGVEDALFTVEITTGGASATAKYRWKKDAGSYTSDVTTATTAATLQEGVQIVCPAGTYVDGDIFIVRVSSQTAPGRPRYEVWPHVVAADVIDFLYVSRPVDINDSGSAIPYSIPGSAILELALSAAARWPGPNVQDRNPYFQVNLEKRHSERAERWLIDLERQDNEIYDFDTMYEDWEWAPYGPIDAKFMQSHA